MTLVIGYLPNQYGDAALTVGLQEARERHHTVVVVNAARGDALGDKRFLSQDALADLEARLGDSGVAYRVHRAVAVDVGAEIVRVAEESHAELVVIGIRPRSALGKMLMGSVALAVITEAPCPVLTVRPDVL
jgi:nucleotide-binding universal stress UspA family protein